MAAPHSTYSCGHWNCFTCCYAFLNCFAVCLQLNWYFTFVQGFVKQMVNPALCRAHGLQWPHQGLTRLPQLPCANHVQVNQAKIGPPFIYCSPYAGKYNTLKNVGRTIPNDFFFICTFYAGSFCFCFSRNTVPFCEEKEKEI